jgi:hypothetical protein
MRRVFVSRMFFRAAVTALLFLNLRGKTACDLLGSFNRFANAWCSPALPTNVYVRSNPLGPKTFIFPTITLPRTNDRHPPVSGSFEQSVFDERPDFRLDAWIAGIVQLE